MKKTLQFVIMVLGRTSWKFYFSDWNEINYLLKTKYWLWLLDVWNIKVHVFKINDTRLLSWYKHNFYTVFRKVIKMSDRIKLLSWTYIYNIMFPYTTEFCTNLSWWCESIRKKVARLLLFFFLILAFQIRSLYSFFKKKKQWNNFTPSLMIIRSYIINKYLNQQVNVESYNMKNIKFQVLL